MNRLLYALHRWTSLAAILQLSVWTTTGFFFAVVPIQRIRGEDRTVPHTHHPIPWDRVGALPVGALAGATEATIRVVDGRPMIVATGGERRWALDATSGAPVEFDVGAAARIARADQVGSPEVSAVTRVESTPIEYRDRPVPAWRVDLSDGRETRVYVDALTGAVTARRNGLWRIYDFLWSLHIMDYRGRDDFNHLLIQGFALIGIATVLTGAVLWVTRASRALQRRARERARVQAGA